MKVIALDFDGVIADSINDLIVTAFNTYLKYNPDTRLFGGKKLTFENFEVVLKENKTTFEKFRGLRTLAKAAKYDVALFYCLEENKEIDNQQEFDEYCKKLDKDQLELFQKDFYLERKRLQELNLDKWYKLSPPFDDVISQAKKLMKEKDVWIVTSKDKNAITKLSSMYDLKINEERIIDKDIGINKSEKIKYLIKKYAIKNEDILFVDDLLGHLTPVNNMGVKCFLATWGYNTQKQREEAKKKGINLLTMEDFYSKLVE